MRLLAVWCEDACSITRACLCWHALASCVAWCERGGPGHRNSGPASSSRTALAALASGEGAGKLRAAPARCSAPVRLLTLAAPTPTMSATAGAAAGGSAPEKKQDRSRDAAAQGKETLAYFGNLNVLIAGLKGLGTEIGACGTRPCCQSVPSRLRRAAVDARSFLSARAFPQPLPSSRSPCVPCSQEHHPHGPPQRDAV